MLEDHFPEAKSISNLKFLLDDELPKNSLNGKNTLWATSICSDEVNQSLHFLDEYFETYGPFVLGGISGIPFAGKTGFKAFVSHIPDDGGAVIIYGPHIGVTKKGTVGEVLREGQESTSTCCGSLVAGLNNLKTGNVLEVAHDDYQQGQVNKVLVEHLDEIQEADHQIIKTTNIAFNQIKKELTDIVGSSLADLSSKPLLLIGGIIINTDWDQVDMFELRDVSWFNN